MQFYQLATICFVTSRKKMQSTLICSLDCDANNIFVWVGIGCGLMPSPWSSPTGRGEAEHLLLAGEGVLIIGDGSSSVPYSPYTDNDGIPQTGGGW